MCPLVVSAELADGEELAMIFTRENNFKKLPNNSHHQMNFLHRPHLTILGDINTAVSNFAQ